MLRHEPILRRATADTYSTGHSIKQLTANAENNADGARPISSDQLLIFAHTFSARFARDFTDAVLPLVLDAVQTHEHDTCPNAAAGDIQANSVGPPVLTDVHTSHAGTNVQPLLTPSTADTADDVTEQQHVSIAGQASLDNSLRSSSSLSLQAEAPATTPSSSYGVVAPPPPPRGITEEEVLPYIPRRKQSVDDESLHDGLNSPASWSMSDYGSSYRETDNAVASASLLRQSLSHSLHRHLIGSSTVADQSPEQWAASIKAKLQARVAHRGSGLSAADAAATDTLAVMGNAANSPRPLRAPQRRSFRAMQLLEVTNTLIGSLTKLEGQAANLCAAASDLRLSVDRPSSHRSAVLSHEYTAPNYHNPLQDERVPSIPSLMHRQQQFSIQSFQYLDAVSALKRALQQTMLK
jgi:hypothetical protein